MQARDAESERAVIAASTLHSLKEELAGSGPVYLIRAVTAKGIAYFSCELDAFEFIASGVVLDIKVLAAAEHHNAKVTRAPYCDPSRISLVRCLAN